MRVGYSIQVRCGCRGSHGERLGQTCPKLWRRDGTWNSKHGSAGFAMRIPTSSGIRLLKRYGFASKAEAKAAVDRVTELLGLSGADDSIRARVGDMIVSATRNGGQLPESADIRRRVAAGTDPAAPAVTFEQAWQSWLSGKKRLRQSARETLEHVGRTWLIPVLADVPVERLNASHCAAVFERIERINSEIAARSDGSRAYVHVDGDVRSRPRLVGAATQHRIYAALREFCNFEVRKTRRMAFNPVYAIELEPEERPEAKRWSAPQAAQFLASSADDPLGLLFRIVLLRGARRGEACGLRWSGADLEAGYVTVARPLLLIGANVVEGRPKTQAGERKIWLDKHTIALLREHRKQQLAARIAAGPAWQDNDLIFCKEDGSPWRPDYVTRRFKVIAKAAGLPVIKLHEGRHSAASLARDADVDPEIRRQTLGHADQAMTSHYTHIEAQAHRAAAEAVARLVEREP